MGAKIITRLVMALILSAVAVTAGARTHVLVVTGIGGEAFFSDNFERWSRTVTEVARDAWGSAPGDVIWLAPKELEGADGEARLSEVKAALHALAGRATPADTVLIMLIGHGTATSGRALFNLPGADASAAFFAEALVRFDGARIVFVNAASASGPFIAKLSAPGRIVITATANARENEFTRFGRFFGEAFSTGQADSDKNGRVSVFEAYEFSRSKVAKTFAEAKLLQTGHPLLDDNGDGVGSPHPALDGDDGGIARAVFLQQEATLSPRQLRLRVAARALVERVENLKRKKSVMYRDEYWAALEDVLLQLARNRRAYRQGGEP